jgi:hypothetical protein
MVPCASSQSLMPVPLAGLSFADGCCAALGGRRHSIGERREVYISIHTGNEMDVPFALGSWLLNLLVDSLGTPEERFIENLRLLNMLIHVLVWFCSIVG